VVDYVLREAYADHSLGVRISNKVGTTTRIKSTTKYIMDLDFADDVILVADNAINFESSLIQ
jgi:hypothetical protein